MHTFRDGRAGTFIHVEPRQSLTASNADVWVRNAPGTEGMLALAVLKLLIDGGMADRRYAEAVTGVDVKQVAEESGVPVETIKTMAETFGHGKPPLAVGGGVAVTGTQAVQTLTAINVLNAATGALGKTVRFELCSSVSGVDYLGAALLPTATTGLRSRPADSSFSSTTTSSRKPDSLRVIELQWKTTFASTRAVRLVARASGPPYSLRRSMRPAGTYGRATS